MPDLLVKKLKTRDFLYFDMDDISIKLAEWIGILLLEFNLTGQSKYERELCISIVVILLCFSLKGGTQIVYVASEKLYTSLAVHIS